MNAREFPEAEEGGFVDGIFNYCDRWCERCTMTTRCRQFAMSSVMDAVDGLEGEFPESDEDSDGGDAAEFWKIFDEAGEPENEAWQGVEQDLCLEDGEESEEFHRRKDELEDNRKHPCSVESMRYLDLAHDWMERLRIELEKREILVPIEKENPRRSIHEDERIERLRDAFDVVSWYHMQIYVKLQRALESRRTEAETPPEYQVDDNGDPFPSDADGSAKVSIVGIDRSLAAWSLLRDGLPDQSEDIFQILVCLDGVRRLVEREFPKARRFQRPGFDE